MSIKIFYPARSVLGGAPRQYVPATSRKDVQATVSGAWDLGIRYFDTAPLYGSGLSEIHRQVKCNVMPRDSMC